MLGALGGLPGMSGYGYEDGTGLRPDRRLGLSDLQGDDVWVTPPTRRAMPLTDEEIADLFGENPQRGRDRRRFRRRRPATPSRRSILFVS